MHLHSVFAYIEIIAGKLHKIENKETSLEVNDFLKKSLSSQGSSNSTQRERQFYPV